ncbi:patatin-like phospholipase family protein [Candidatus Nitrotoga arctica]|nr:patatin-like phospholipase family protein [Candidatus Nitrotoga arctica]
MIPYSCRAMAALALLLVLATSGCAHYPVNTPLATFQQDSGYRFVQDAVPPNTNSLFVCLVFSGGGTRAAAFSYGIMEKLRDTKIVWQGVTKSLLDEVDCISSVSGGSFTAAYYGLFGEQIFSDFRTHFLERNVQRELFGKALAPTNWLRLASPTFSRIDLAAELYDEVLFEGKTFKDLADLKKRPFVIINSTNLANGDGFQFTQAQFDFLGSDLATYPISRAVTASSAFPFLLSPLSLKNYASPENYVVPTDVKLGKEDFYVNRRRYQWALNQLAYLDKEARPYVHLMDGGLADNIGLRPLEDAFLRTSGFIRSLINEGEIDRLVFIVVNARTDDQGDFSRAESPPSLGTVAFKTATIALDNYSFETIEFMRDLAAARKQTQMVIAACQKMLDKCMGQRLPQLAKTIEPYVIEVNFEAISDPGRRNYFLGLPTRFSLSRNQVKDLVDIGPQLLDQSPDFKALLESLSGN